MIKNDPFLLDYKIATEYKKKNGKMKPQTEIFKLNNILPLLTVSQIIDKMELFKKTVRKSRNGS